MFEEKISADNKIPDESALSIDVIIPVYKPDSRFNRLMDRLVKQSIKPKRIILLHTVDHDAEIDQDALSYALGLSTADCSVEFIEIQKPEFDHGGTRNLGASLSDAKIMLFMTQDAVPADNCLIQTVLEPFRDIAVAAVYGRQLPTSKSSVIESYTRQFNYPKKSFIKTKGDLPRLGIKTYFCSNVCAAYRKSVYEELGGFAVKTIFNEDMIMAAAIINADYAIAYSAKTRVYHSHTYTYIQQFRRNFDLAVSQKQYEHIFSGVKSENEGIKLVKKTMEHLIKIKQYQLIPELIFQSGFKYLGYLAGINYEHFPKELIRKLSMNPSYWN